MGSIGLCKNSLARWFWRRSALWTILLVDFILISHGEGQDDLTSICRSASALHSCGQCIKQSPQCVWCTDPAFEGGYRCDVETNLVNSCPPQFLYQSKSNVQLTENIEAGTYEAHHARVRQTQPQEVHVLIKPGETVSFPFKYYHVPNEERDVYLLNSETESQGITLSFSVDCKGIHKHDRECRGVRNSDLIVYNVSVQVRGCSSNAVVSIGVSGVREVTALYIHPQCGCDCERPEKQELRSGHCNGWGTLVCGSCICDDPRKGGRHCECDLSHGQSTAQLEDMCREEPNKALCNGHGHCSCGVCQCDSQYSGKYCDCSFAPCPAADGEPCAGRGTCNCGKCECEAGWSGPACSCSRETDGCLSEDGKICSGHGTCLCNKCNCLQGYEGSTCESQPGFVPTEPSDAKPEGDDHEDDDGEEEEATSAPTEPPGADDEDHPIPEPEPEPAPSEDEESTAAPEDGEPTAESHQESSPAASCSSKHAISAWLLSVFALIFFLR